jgi:uncharacterized protein YabE (DUF348 family)
LGKHYVVRRRKLLISTFFVVIILSFVAIWGTNARASDTRIVSVYADGVEKTINSNVGTVSDALVKAKVKINEHDLVEPSVDTQINDVVYKINVYRARPVTVVDGHIKRQVMTPYTSNRLIAADAGIIVYEEDNFVLERVDNILESGIIGQKLTIIRATPVNINLYGSDFEHRTHMNTVGEALAEKGIVLKENDKVEPSFDSSITEGSTINVIHVGTEVEAREETIDFKTEYIYDDGLLNGIRKVEIEGQSGIRLVTYEVVRENEEEVSKKELQSVVATKPTSEVIRIGTKIPDPASNQAIGQRLADDRGWEGDEWTCLYNLWVKESQWNHTAENPSSGAYGIPQALPGSRMADVASDWQTNPETQIIWGLNYIAGRYSTPCGAWNFFLNNNWY